MNEAEQDGPLVGQQGKTDKMSESDPQRTPVGSHTEGPPEAPVLDIHAYIGSRLRKAFDDVASQPVPDRFLQLMQELDKG